MKIDVNSVATKIEVDNRIPLRYYYRIADSLLKQASIYREEKNVVDLYILLLRFSSLMLETIPKHRDYKNSLPKERAIYSKKLRGVIVELESLKPEFDRQNNDFKKAHALSQLDSPESSSYASGLSSFNWSSVDGRTNSGRNTQMTKIIPQTSWQYNSSHGQVLSLNTAPINKQFQNISLRPVPSKETLSRHSLLGPDGLGGQWLGPTAEIKVQYPSNADLAPIEIPSLNKAGEYDIASAKSCDTEVPNSTMESVLSLDDGRWSSSAEESQPSLINEMKEDPFRFVSIRQPSPPPVLAPISPSKVADPRPGPAKVTQDGLPSSSSYHHLHVPVYILEDFLRLAGGNTRKNLETCGILAGSLKNRVFHITTLIIPKQESTSDSCQTLNEEEIFEVQDRLSLFPLGWIHTHPTQTCFMSSVDLHTHYSYQIMLPEAIAIVMAPTDESSPHGIFHLSDPGGVTVIRNCQERGFHPHEEPPDGSPLYEHCSHVYMNPKLKFDVVDLR